MNARLLALAISLLTFLNALVAQTVNTAYDQLVGVNEQWKNQTDIDPSLKTKRAISLTEQELVKFHLQETEKLLRNRNTDFLPVAAKRNREVNLNTLQAYWQKGLFPVNDKHINRQPYFIDKFNTYCAVGYLMQQSGADDVAKDINRTQNFSYLLDISHPKLMKWVSESGLSLDELALIQPGYGGEWPSTITELHYNNTGSDVNEYIEVHQSNGRLTGLGALSSILFYDHLGILYKTLQLNEMTGFYRNNTQNRDSFYYYTFPTNLNLADSGKIELRGSSTCGALILSTFTYNSSGIRLEEFSPCYPSSTVKNYIVKEDETTPAGSSATFCGLYYSTWNPTIQLSTPGTLNPCTVGALPISLSVFNYTLTNKTVQLKWQTESESNNSYFEIERSVDGVNFQSIGRVKGSGTSSIARDYIFTDDKPNYNNHYRLKQVDLDGKSSYSKILFVKVAKSNPLTLKENVVKTTLQVQISSNESNVGSIVIYDFSGREALRIKATNGSQNINISGLSGGKYLIQLQTNNGQYYNQQFIKQ